MKKKLFLILPQIFLLFVLAACGWGKTHQINYFLEGEFIGVDLNDKETEFYLKVLPITKEVFDNQNGVGVVHDVYKDLYYKLELYILLDDNDKKEIIFNNLKAYGTPYRYGDNAGNIIKPMISQNNPFNDDSIVYILEIKYKENTEKPIEKYYIHLKIKRKEEII